MANNYVATHVHSYYSMLDGLSSPEEYMKRASELGMNALAITDHGNVSGWLDFYEAGQKYGVKPLLGAELYQARQTRFHRDEIERSNKKATQEYGQSGPHHITMIAKNYEGYKNLLKMSSRAYTESFYVKPRVGFDLFEEYSKGVIATSGCVSGKIPSALLRDDFDYALETASTMRDIFGKENFFIEVQDHGLEDQRRVMTGLIDIANRLDLKIIATPDSHYAYPDQSEIHDILLAIGTGAKVHEENRFQFPADKFYLPSYEEMAQIFDKQWLQNTNDLAEMCELELNFDQLYFPHFEVPNSQNPVEYFEQQVYKGLEQKYDVPLSEEVTQRAEYEMDVIKRMGFVEYFLIVADVVNWCDQQGIKTGPRGSAAASICSYALGITKIDPLYFALRFERFLTFGRGSSAPDIDLDIDDRYRGQVIEYTKQKYGEDHVSHIGTFAGVKARLAIRDVTRVLNYTYQKGDTIAKMIPEPVQGFTYSIDEALEARKDLASAYDEDDDTKEIIDKARGIEGVVRQSGIHAGGIVISQAPMIEHIPVMQRPDKTGKPGPVVTQWEDSRVEQVGLLKMDYLGLKNLAIIGRCCQSIQDRHGLELSEHNIPWDDDTTYKMLRNGESLGCFQIEGPQMRELMMGIQPDRIEDLAALVALYRPGPMGSGLDKEYVERKQGRKESKPVHPLLEDSLKRSYNLMIYQEQVLDAARILAGFDPQEREALRKALGKKKREVVNELRQKFVTQCWEVNGIAEAEASRIYDQIEYFGAYSFNLCLTGDTELTRGAANHHGSPQLKIEDLYRRLHSQLEPQKGRHGKGVYKYKGPCTACGAPEAAIRGQCKACVAWLKKFHNPKKGLFVLALDTDNRIRPKRVKDVHYNGVAPTWKITLSSGKTITATANHRHMTPKGWARVDELVVGDELVINEGYEPDSDSTDRVTNGVRQAQGRVNGALREENYGWIDGNFVKLTAWTASAPNYCERCGVHRDEVSRLERAHLDGDRTNNDDENLAMFCVSCHKKHDYEYNSRKRRWQKGHLAGTAEITAIEYAGEQDVYDVEMDDVGHNFVANGVVTHNSHAASYGFITYVTAYLKANYPVDYMAAVLTTTKTKDAMAPYLNECRRMGLHVVPPSVNRSQNDFAVEDDKTIVFGLDSIDGIGVKVTDEILKAREDKPFESLHDFIRRVPSRVLDRRVFSHLAASGAFDELVQNESNTRLSHDDIQYVLGLEYRELGMYVSQHPVEDVEEILQQEVTSDLDRLIEYSYGDIVTVGGVLIDVQKKVTKKGKDMWLLHIEDLTTSTPVLVFGQPAHDYYFEVGELVLIKGKVTIEGEDHKQAKLILQQRDFLPKPQHPDEQPLLVIFGETPSYEDVQSLASIGWNSQGSASLRFQIPYGNNYVTMEVDDAIDKQKVKTEFNQKGYKTQEMSL